MEGDRVMIPPEQQALVDSCVPMARSVANYFSQRYRSLEDDLRQEALISLYDAAKRFQPARGLRFSTYAHNVIYWGCRNFLSRRGLPAIRAVSIECIPTRRCERHGQLVGDWRTGRTYLSHEELVDMRDEADAILCHVHPRRRLVYELRNRDGLKLAEIARRMGISRQRALQLYNLAAANVRELVRERIMIESGD